MLELNTWVIHPDQLPARAGHSRDFTLQVPLDDGWGNDVAQIPSGSTVAVEGRMDGVVDGVMVDAAIDATVTSQCVRCLDAFTEDLSLPLCEMFFAPYAITRMQEEGDDEAAELPQLGPQGLDLEQAVRDVVVGSLPFQPLCAEDCAGLCQDCGTPWRELPADHAHEQLDPRLAVLAQLLPTEEQ